MNIFTHTLPRLLLAAALALPAIGALAQDAAPQVQGEIRKVDTGAGKLTIRHSEIPNLEMPPMTMVFRAAPELLAKAREGDKVRFTAQRVDGALTVTSLETQQ
ncbi:copper-binding protein [Herbaspirillum sp.]|uniref:copper-binding protein n=1 Tax=Herbaspirillum sp. TaxID=1890675 RepID=UPI0031DFE702